jgi:hypothetical protein
MPFEIRLAGEVAADASEPKQASVIARDARSCAVSADGSSAVARSGVVAGRADAECVTDGDNVGVTAGAAADDHVEAAPWGGWQPFQVDSDRCPSSTCHHISSVDLKVTGQKHSLD